MFNLTPPDWALVIIVFVGIPTFIVYTVLGGFQ